MSQVSTKQKILNAAEILFAKHGFDNTSLRMITTDADVNVAAVNYHFGSKKELIQAVLDRYFTLFVPKLMLSLKASLADKEDAFTLTDFYSAFIQPLLSLSGIHSKATATFMILVGRGYSETQGHLRRYFTTHYGELLSLLLDSVLKAKPELTRATVFWRLHFALGSVVFTMTSNTALREIALADFDKSTSIEDLIYELVPYLAAGMNAE
ncbi:TetR/AcrR family transcriptional regulator [Algibacillus agarilyticus]|uniref:TetR/AcrR family transcriptional regulator n=1 Tax=Algibacillus agarilyticus TaxID=2234133 RepID=UPI000DCFFC33|nr:TetR/AcrR family transcriptional regulator [Algibacillus agarilyticus]